MNPSRVVLCVFVCLAAALLAGCHNLQVADETRVTAADDGTPLTVHRLFEWRFGGAAHAEPRGTLFYIQGSEPTPVTNATGSFAGACAMGLDLVMVDRRGVNADGSVDRAKFDETCTKQLRVADHLRVIDDMLARRKGGGPVIVVGASEGGDVAAAVAAAEPRITHLVLLGSGGGWTQEEEFRDFIREGRGGLLGMPTQSVLDDAIARLRADPDSTAQWLGLPHKRWTSFMFSRPAEDLRGVDVPILLVQGDADENVPVGSARALRDRFAEWGKANLTYLELEGVDHHFVHIATGSKALPLVEVALVDWMAKGGVLSADEAAAFNNRVRRNHPEWFAPAR